MEKILAIIFTLIEMSVVNQKLILIYCRYSPLDNDVQLFVYQRKGADLVFEKKINLAGEAPLDELLIAEDVINELIAQAKEQQQLRESAA